MLKTVFVEELERISSNWGELIYYENIGWCMVYNSDGDAIPIDKMCQTKNTNPIQSRRTIKLIAFVPDDSDERTEYFRFVGQLIRGIVDDETYEKYVYTVL